jgi:hypothetical protein
VPPIYHITPIDNLPGIIKEGGLFCDRDAKKIKFVSIGHKDIKERRIRKRVPLGRGGVLADYVPFYFAPRSPMLYTINRGNVEGYTRGQEQSFIWFRPRKRWKPQGWIGSLPKGTP